MSRASTAGFSDFFPSAPRSAKNRAKERERAKSKPLDSPLLEPVNTDRDAHIPSRSRDESGRGSSISGAAGEEGARDTNSRAATDEGDLQQGDLLNCVQSTSSHASTTSSIFSNTAPNSGAAAASNLISLTPLTNDDSSPIGQVASPRGPKAGLKTPSSLEHVESSSPKHVLQNTPPAQDMAEPQRAQVRDRDKPKGQRCVFDPQLDKSGIKPKPKVKYKDISWVCINHVGSVILRVH